MTLHVALDSINDVEKAELVETLSVFLSRKEYKVKTLSQPTINPILSILKDYNLTNSERALLSAADRSITFNNGNFEDFDIVLWNGSVLRSYVYYTDNIIKSSFIRTVNKYFPEMDCYIVIRAENQNHEPVRKFDKLIRENRNVHSINYAADDPEGMMNEIVNILFRELPTCSWCGRLFTKSVFNKKYCSNNCKKYAKEEQNRDNFRNYYNRYKDTMSEAKKGALGSKGANLHGTANPDPEVELRLINNEKMRLGLN